MTRTRWLLGVLACGLIAIPVTILAQNGMKSAPARLPTVATVAYQEKVEPAPTPKPEPPPAPSLDPFSPNSKPAPDKPTTPKPTPRDPTTVRPDLRNILDPPEATARATLPAIQLRGRIVLPNGKGIGMLEVDKQYFKVEAGSRIDAGGVLMEVKSLSATETVVFIEELNRTLTLR